MDELVDDLGDEVLLGRLAEKRSSPKTAWSIVSADLCPDRRWRRGRVTTGTVSTSPATKASSASLLTGLAR